VSAGGWAGTITVDDAVNTDVPVEICTTAVVASRHTTSVVGDIRARKLPAVLAVAVNVTATKYVLELFGAMAQMAAFGSVARIVWRLEAMNDDEGSVPHNSLSMSR